MVISILDHGAGAAGIPKRQHPNDVGADVFARHDLSLDPDCTQAMDLGFGLDLPAGFAAFIFVRSSMAKAGIECYLPPIDPGYTGPIHAILHNDSRNTYNVHAGDRIGQLVILPVATPDFAIDLQETRGAGAFGSTGK